MKPVKKKLFFVRYVTGLGKLKAYVERLAARAPLEEARQTFQELLALLKVVVDFHSKLLNSLQSKAASVASALRKIEQFEG